MKITNINKRLLDTDEVGFHAQSLALHSQEIRKQIERFSHKDNAKNIANEKNIYTEAYNLVTDDLINELNDISNKLFDLNNELFRESEKLNKEAI